MSWNVTEQRSADLRALWALFIGADQDTPVQSREAIEKELHSHGISKMRSAHALDNLVNANCAATTEKGYYITAHGIDWVEDTFDFSRNSKTNYTFYPKHRNNVLGVLQKDIKKRTPVAGLPEETANWAKIGAMAAIVSIFVAIFVWWAS